MRLTLGVPQFGGQALVVAIQLGNVALFDRQGLLQLAQLGLQLLDLSLMPTLILLPLLLHRLAVMLQGFAGMLMLFLQGLPMGVTFL